MELKHIIPEREATLDVGSNRTFMELKLSMVSLLVSLHLF